VLNPFSLGIVLACGWLCCWAAAKRFPFCSFGERGNPRLCIPEADMAGICLFLLARTANLREKLVLQHAPSSSSPHYWWRAPRTVMTWQPGTTAGTQVFIWKCLGRLSIQGDQVIWHFHCFHLPSFSESGLSHTKFKKKKKRERKKKIKSKLIEIPIT